MPLLSLTPMGETDAMQLGPEVMWVLIAMAGGVARYLDQFLKTGEIPRIGLLAGHALVSGFAGYMVVQVTLKFSADWAIVAAGAGGYMGTQALDWISSLLKSKVSGFIPSGPPKKDDHHGGGSP